MAGCRAVSAADFAEIVRFAADGVIAVDAVSSGLRPKAVATTWTLLLPLGWFQKTFRRSQQEAE
jgi:hypothetical protein